MGGMCSFCFGDPSPEPQRPTESEIANRRERLAEAAEQRMAQSESRGVKDVFKVRRQQERAAKMEQAELEAAQHGEASLRWQTS